MKDKKRVILLIIIGILIVITIALGLTKAFMVNLAPEVPQSTEVNLSSCATVQLLDEKNAINLTNTHPVTDNVGLNTTPYEFTIKSTCDDQINQTELYLGVLSDSTLNIRDLRGIKYALKDVDTGIIVKTGNLSAADSTSIFKDYEKSRIGNTSTIVSLGADIALIGELRLQLYLWVNSTVTAESTMGKTLTARLIVKDRNIDYEEYSIPYECKNRELASCLKENYNYYFDTHIIYHSESGALAASGTQTSKNVLNSNLGAQDNSYRFVGKNPNNYVCFGSDEEICPEDNLYRIIGAFDDDKDGVYQLKLIKNTSVGNKKMYSSDKKTQQTWVDSEINTEYLNRDFWNAIPEKWQNIIATPRWSVGGLELGTVYTYNYNPQQVLELEMNYSVESNVKIGLMYVTDYAFAISPQYWNQAAVGEWFEVDNLWIHSGNIEWTITPTADHKGDFYYLYDDGMISSDVGFNEYAIRPVFYLNSSVTLVSGFGTATNPYRIK